MKKESEKKKKVTSIRLTEEQQKRVQAKAEANDMTVSNYIITTVVNGEPALTPKVMIQVQNIVNSANAIAKEFAPDKAVQIESEVNKLWSQLK